MKNKMEENSIEKFDQAKTKVMNYIMYKKRTEYEVRNKFSKLFEENLLDDIIQYVKEAGYLSDADYIQRTIAEYKALNYLSRKEIRYKLYAKGIENSQIEDYFHEHEEELYEYELASAQQMVRKKKNTMQQEEIENYLRKKGYVEDIIQEALEGETQ